MITLALDASTYEGSVAVLDGSRLLGESDAAMRGRDAERLMPAVEAVLTRSGMALSQVDRLVCGAGPGSFTSLRIAGSLAKGLALGAAKPLFAVSSLALVVAANVAEKGRYLALLDAIRGEFFAACFEFDGANVTPIGDATLVMKSEIDAVASRQHARAVGPDFGGWKPHARGVSRLEQSIGKPVNLAEWEPTYGRLPEAQVKLEAAIK
jgi:tRNA threonylcarbamoyladenosine biosynthesis protein TsaB